MTLFQLYVLEAKKQTIPSISNITLSLEKPFILKKL